MKDSSTTASWRATLPWIEVDLIQGARTWVLESEDDVDGTIMFDDD